MRASKRTISIAIAALFLAAEVVVWLEVIRTPAVTSAKIYFLDVGQGDSELLILPQNVKIMTDAGPNRKVATAISRVPEVSDRYIDIAMISHPQSDHFRGFSELIQHIRFGAFITNGRSGTASPEEWKALLDEIALRRIPIIPLGGGARISCAGATIDFLSPSASAVKGKDVNDSGIATYVQTAHFTALLTADIGPKIERVLVQNKLPRVDILKVPHHGSKFSSTADFLRALSPKAAVIEVGVGNSYGHPAAETLARLASSAATVFRTDQNGTIAIEGNGAALIVSAERPTSNAK